MFWGECWKVLWRSKSLWFGVGLYVYVPSYMYNYVNMIIFHYLCTIMDVQSNMFSKMCDCLKDQQDICLSYIMTLTYFIDLCDHDIFHWLMLPWHISLTYVILTYFIDLCDLDIFYCYMWPWLISLIYVTLAYFIDFCDLDTFLWFIWLWHISLTYMTLT